VRHTISGLTVGVVLAGLLAASGASAQFLQLPKSEPLPPPSAIQSAPLPAPMPPVTQEAPPAPLWQPRGTAELQALDKVNAKSQTFAVKVGQSVTFGTLTIAVAGCMVQPPDQPPEATAYLTIADSNPGSPGFKGWMFADRPALSMLQHPIYDVRVTGCQS
jgi:hypothetical protein